MTDAIKEFWQIIAAALGAAFFIVRMESRTAEHGRELARLQTQRDNDQAVHQRSRDETHGLLRDVNGKLDRLIERMMK
jgi:hypothetical protein